jgi:hypothetical protein
MHNYRQAALCLHGLVPDDRQWLLSHLPERHRSALHALLDELQSLGIPGDGDPQEYADNVLHQSGGDALDAAVLEIEAASPEHIQLLLEGESEAVVTALLAARDWSWKSDVIARFRKNHRSIAISDSAISVKVYTSMVTAVAARLRRHLKSPAWNKTLRRAQWQP